MKGSLIWLTDNARAPTSPPRPAPTLLVRLVLALRLLLLWLRGCVCGPRAAPSPEPSSGSERMRVSSRRHVYLCHPHPCELGGETGGVRKLATELMAEGLVPITPMLGHHQLEGTDREQVAQLGLALLERCDEMRVYGAWLTKSMRAEVEHASRLGIATIFINGGRA